METSASSEARSAPSVLLDRRHGARLNDTDEDELTALAHAERNNDREMVDLLRRAARHVATAPSGHARVPRSHGP